MSKITKLPSGKTSITPSVRPNEKTNKKTEKDSKKKTPLAINNAHEILKSNYDRKKHNELILTMNPDLERAKGVIASTILSPNDMKTTNLVYGSNLNLPAGVANDLSDLNRDYLEEEYGLTNRLDDVIDEGMFDEGAYILVTVPTKNITYLQNYEKDYEKGIETFLGEKTNDPTLITTTDGLGLLTYADNYIDNHADLTFNSLGTESLAELDKAVYKGVNDALNDKKLMKELPDYSLLDNNELKYKDDSSPLLKKINVDSFLPIFRPGDNKEEIGGWVFLDSDANPIDFNQVDLRVKVDNVSPIEKAFSDSYRGENEKLKELVSVAKTLPEAIKLYEESVEIELRKKLDLQKIGNVTDLNLSQEIKDVLFTRALKDLKTRVIYVPKNKLTFIRFESRLDGTGKPILEKIRLLASMRVNLLFANLSIAMKNSITNTLVDVTLPKNETDVDGAMADMKTAIIGNRANILKFGLLDPNDISDHLHNAGYIWKFSGPGIPEYTVNISETNRDIKEIDSDIIEKLDKMIIMAFGLPPKLAEDGASDTLATAIRENLELLDKYINVKQRVINKGMTHLGKTILSSSPKMIAKIEEIMTKEASAIKNYLDLDKNLDKKALGKLLTEKYINNLTINLPTNTTEEENGTIETFNARYDFIEKVVELTFSSDVFNEELAGDIATDIDSLQEAVKGVLMRRWLKDNKFVPEIAEMIKRNDDGSITIPLIEEVHMFNSDVSSALITVLKKVEKDKRKYDKKVEKIQEEEEEEAPVEDNENTDEGGEEEPTPDAEEGDEPTGEEEPPPEDDNIDEEV